MRIIYFSRDYTTHDHRFLTALSKTDHQVFYLRLEGGRQTLEDRPLPPGIEPVQWAGGNQPARLKDGFRLLESLREVIRQVKPDLIHAGPIQRCALLAALADFHPLVSVSWGYDLLHDANINPFWSLATRYTLYHSDAFVGDCDTIRKLAVSYGMPDEQIVTFPWGIDLSHFNVSTRQRLNDPTFNLLSTRSWEPIYGIDVIARAFVIAARKRPELQTHPFRWGFPISPHQTDFISWRCLRQSNIPRPGIVFRPANLLPEHRSIYRRLPQRWHFDILIGSLCYRNTGHCPRYPRQP